MSAAAAATKVSIEGIDKKDLLRRLWHAQSVAVFFTASGIPAPEWVEPTDETVSRFIDYYFGRRIHCDLSDDAIDPRGYDAVAGEGTLARVVEEARRASSQK